jgi:hypothetical protein
MNRGSSRLLKRRTSRTPSSTLSVSRISATVPVERVRYQYALGPEVLAAASTCQDPPETTGAGAGAGAGADCTGADCTGADCAGADCTGADCAGADCTGADCAGADCTGADCTGADCTGATGAELCTRG